MVRKTILAALTATTLFLPMNVFAAGANTVHDTAAEERVLNNVIAKPAVSVATVRCMKKVYWKAISLGSSSDEALGTACGLCHVSC